MLSACGGADDGNSSNSGGAPTGISEAYYPISIGSSWSYDATSSDLPAPFINNVQITGTQLVSDRMAHVFHESNALGDGVASDSHYVKDARAFTYVGDNGSPNLITAVIGNVDEMRFDGTFSATPLVNKVNVDIGEDLDGDNINERMDVSVTGIVEGSETLVTSAGTFSNTMRLRYDTTGTVKLSRGGSVSLSQTAHEWRAPGIGIIQASDSTSVGGQTTSTSLVLRGFSVDGAVGGVLMATELMPFLAQADSNTQQPGRPAVASNGTNFLVVSKRVTTNGSQWIAQIIGADGAALKAIDLSPVLLQSFDMPAVSWDGNNFLVVTSADAVLHGQRVSATGTVIDSYPGIEIADGRYPSVASGGNTYFVVYVKYTGHSGPWNLYGRLLSPSGVIGLEILLATDIPIAFPNITGPAVAYDGSNFLVAWETASATYNDIVATRVSPSGVVLDAVPIDISTAPEAQTAPQIACDGTNCLISWVDRRNYPGSPYNFTPGPGDMYGAFVSKEGLLLNGAAATGGLALATEITANQGSPALTFTGSEYLLAWSSGYYANNPGGATGVYVARLSTNGAVLPVVNVSGSPAPYTIFPYMALASSSTGTLAVWLNNIEMSGTTKSINGAMIYPLAVR